MDSQKWYTSNELIEKVLSSSKRFDLPVPAHNLDLFEKHLSVPVIHNVLHVENFVKLKQKVFPVCFIPNKGWKNNKRPTF